MLGWGLAGLAVFLGSLYEYMALWDINVENSKRRRPPFRIFENGLDKGPGGNEIRACEMPPRRSRACTSHGRVRHGTTLLNRLRHGRAPSPCRRQGAMRIA